MPRSVFRALAPGWVVASPVWADQIYKPTVGLETESTDLKAYPLKPAGATPGKLTSCLHARHAMPMMETEASSAEVSSLKLMYMTLDGANKKEDAKGTRS